MSEVLKAVILESSCFPNLPLVWVYSHQISFGVPVICNYKITDQDTDRGVAPSFSHFILDGRLVSDGAAFLLLLENDFQSHPWPGLSD